MPSGESVVHHHGEEEYSQDRVVDSKLYSLSSCFSPTAYHVTLDIEWDTLKYSGYVVVHGKLNNKTADDSNSYQPNTIQMHSHGHDIKSIEIIHGKNKWKAEANVVDKENDVYEFVPCGNEKFDFSLNSTPDIQVGINFNSSVKEGYDGLYINSTAEDDLVAGKPYYVASQCEDTGCRKIFPCIDEPNAKAEICLSVTLDKQLTVLSNTDIVDKETHGSKITHKFSATPKMSTYLFALFIGDFVYLPAYTKLGVSTNIFTRKKDLAYGEYAQKWAPKMMEYFEKYYDIKYNLKKCDIVALDKFLFGAMENWGMISFRKAAVLVTPETTLESVRYIAQVIAHEISHQWFGNLVTMKWWSDLWLNEGFATLMMYTCIRDIDPSLFAVEYFMSTRMFEGHLLDSLHASHPISVEITNVSEIDEVFDAISYNKAASFLRMINEYITEDSFRKGVAAYLKKYEYSNADYKDFLNALESTAGREGGFSFVDLSHKWLLDLNFPIVTVEKKSDSLFHLTQSRFTRLGIDMSERAENVWQIPMSLSVYGPSGLVNNSKFMLKQYSTDYNIDNPQNTVLFNANHSGFFFVVYDKELLDHIALNIHLMTEFDVYSIIMSHGITIMANIDASNKVLDSVNIEIFVNFISNTYEKLSMSCKLLVSKILAQYYRIFNHIPHIMQKIKPLIKDHVMKFTNLLLDQNKSLDALEEKFLSNNTVLLALYIDKNPYSNGQSFELSQLKDIPSYLVGAKAILAMLADQSGENFDVIFEYGKKHHDSTVKQAMFNALAYTANVNCRQKLFSMLFDGSIEVMNSMSVGSSLSYSSSVSKEFAQYLLQGSNVQTYSDVLGTTAGSRCCTAFWSLTSSDIAQQLSEKLLQCNFKGRRAVAQFLETAKINEKLLQNLH